MTCGRFWFGAGVAVLALGASALADIVVEQYTSVSGGTPTTTTYASGANISLTLGSTIARINIYSNAPGQSDDIGLVTINGTGASDVHLIIGTGPLTQTTFRSTPGARHWAGLQCNGPDVWLCGRISGDLTGNVAAPVIQRLEADGAIQSAVTKSVSGPFWTVGGSFSASAVVRATAGDIGLVNAKTASMLGDVTCDAGFIQNILCSGNIGSSSDLSQIQSWNGIVQVQAPAIYANITANTSNPNTGSISRLVTTSGDFVGSLTVSEVGVASDTFNAIQIAGSVNANITSTFSLFRPVVIGGTLTGGSVFKIGGSINDGTGIAVGSLAGAIIVNTANASWPVWAAPVLVGSGPQYSLLANYSTTSSQLGGGAVGFAPFRVHTNDCNPTHQGHRFAAGVTTANPIVVRYYGPIQRRSGSTGPLSCIEHWLYRTNEWVPCDAAFTVAIHPTLSRAVSIAPAPGVGLLPGRYRVKPTTDLVCSQVTGNPAVHQPTSDWYEFYLAVDCNGNGQPDSGDFNYALSETCHGDLATTDCNGNGVRDSCDVSLSGYPDVNSNQCLDRCESACPCNWNGDSVFDSQDYFDFINDFFSANADFNLDGFTDSQDFFDFLNCFFAGCA